MKSVNAKKMKLVKAKKMKMKYSRRGKLAPTIFCVECLFKEFLKEDSESMVNI